MKRWRCVTRGAQVAESGGVREGVSPSLPGKGSGEGTRLPPQNIFYYLTSKWTEHFGAVFKLDLTEETRTQLQEEEAIASSCLVLTRCDICQFRSHNMTIFSILEKNQNDMWTHVWVGLTEIFIKIWRTLANMCIRSILRETIHWATYSPLIMWFYLHSNFRDGLRRRMYFKQSVA